MARRPDQKQRALRAFGLYVSGRCYREVAAQMGIGYHRAGDLARAGYLLVERSCPRTYPMHVPSSAMWTLRGATGKVIEATRRTYGQWSR